MRLRPWHLLLAIAALAVPLQAGALSGGGGGLAVSASLDHCGVAGNGISCKIDASWSGVDGADRYTATVTLADGSVRDLGAVGTGPGGGSTSVWVPYTGSGTYTVTISAWGADPEGKEQKLGEQEGAARDRESDGSRREDDDEPPTDEGPAAGDETDAEPQDPAGAGEPGQPVPASPAPAPTAPEPEPDPAAEETTEEPGAEEPGAEEAAPAAPATGSAPVVPEPAE